MTLQHISHIYPEIFVSKPAPCVTQPFLLGQEVSLRNPIDVEIGEHLLVMGGSGEKPEVHVRSSETKGDEGYIDIL